MTKFSTNQILSIDSLAAVRQAGQKEAEILPARAPKAKQLEKVFPPQLHLTKQKNWQKTQKSRKVENRPLEIEK